MGQVIKKIFIMLVIIALICGAIFVGKRYKELKESGKLAQIFETNKSSNKDEFGPVEYVEASSNNDENINENESEDTVQENKKDDREFIVEEKDYEGYYNKFIFDNTILLYEGKQTGDATRELVDILIKNVDDPMYSKPTVELKNVGGLSSNVVNQNNFEQYKNVLNEFRNQIGNKSYEVSFEYAKFSSIVNKIIIIKK